METGATLRAQSARAAVQRDGSNAGCVRGWRSEAGMQCNAGAAFSAALCTRHLHARPGAWNMSLMCICCFLSIYIANALHVPLLRKPALVPVYIHHIPTHMALGAGRSAGNGLVLLAARRAAHGIPLLLSYLSLSRGVLRPSLPWFFFLGR